MASVLMTLFFGLPRRADVGRVDFHLVGGGVDHIEAAARLIDCEICQRLCMRHYRAEGSGRAGQPR